MGGTGILRTFLNSEEGGRSWRGETRLWFWNLSITPPASAHPRSPNTSNLRRGIQHYQATLKCSGLPSPQCLPLAWAWMEVQTSGRYSCLALDELLKYDVGGMSPVGHWTRCLRVLKRFWSKAASCMLEDARTVLQKYGTVLKEEPNLCGCTVSNGKDQPVISFQARIKEETEET